MSIVYDDSKEPYEIIKDNYFNKNFGSLSKSEVDLLMFKFYLEDLIKNNKDEDGTVNYSIISDYKIAKELGITPQRVRNLKVKKELVFPQPNFNWKDSLRRVLENENAIRILNGNIKVNIPDPNLFYAIQDSIEDEGGYLDIQLNTKLLSVPIDDFMNLFKLIGTEEECKEIEKTIEKEYKKINKSNETTLSKIQMVSEIVSNSVSAVTDIASLFTPVGSIGKAAVNIFSKIFGGINKWKKF